MTYRILLVEDNPADIALIRMALEDVSLPVEFEECHDGEAAIAAVARLDAAPTNRHPQLILLDLNLPRVHGSEVLKAVRASAHLAATPVVVLSSSDRPADRTQCQLTGITAYLVKPRGVPELMALAQRLAQILQGTSQ